MMKGQKGITLVALIITIIVMLILVGVTITIALDEDNGIISKGKQGGADYENKAAEENVTMVNYQGNIIPAEDAIDQIAQ